jgi:hypothetical protein
VGETLYLWAGEVVREEVDDEHLIRLAIVAEGAFPVGGR